MLYYAMVMAAVVMFGLQFFCNQQYERECKSGLSASMMFIFGGAVAGLVVLLAVNGFKWEFTPFTVLMASLAALDGMAFSFCSLKALGKINLSLYSLFSMLGGMVLPFCLGVFFFDEQFTFGKAICLVAVIAALFLSVEKGEGKGGTVYYIGVFVFNGLSGVISKFFQASELPKTSEAAYSVWTAVMTALISGVILIFVLKKSPLKLNAKALISMAGNGILNRVANFLLLLSLAYLPASVQYPMITGGVMIVSTLLGYFTPNKPKTREWISLALSFAGIMALVLL
ncbi:MAG: LPXTG cell wall anchor domain-containing protein [Clostridia bacterium]|nr:LPXTG cell wall anchor domain-containing protein [Clostridia bacterium]